ncbi:MAG TPA: glycosyltransferase family 1 protein [Ktedonobacterales bacterium]|nr:glycosyltransferase family 1 protein [Ktedonobacterales bacterium]
MRVAFNAQFLQEPHTGTGRYVYNLLQSLGRVDGMTEYLVLSPRDPRETPDTPSTFKWEVAPAGQVSRGGENIEKVWWEQRTFPQAAKRADATIMHVPHFAPPLRTYAIPTIVTIHDVISLRLPAYRASPAVQAYTRLVARAAKRATMVVAVSEHCKRDIIETLGLPEERVRVIREAPVMQYHRVTDPDRLAAVRAKYGLGERFVLNVGGVDQRKNIAGLVGAFAAVFHEMGDPYLQLFIAGDPERLGSSPLFPDWRPLTTTFGIADNVVCAPIDEEDLPVVYSAATCFAFASVYEGFGLTPLEAMACGAPVVCSDRTSLPEVVGSAGILVNPEDPDAFGGAIKRVLTSQKLREDLGARGLARVKLFGWDRVAVETSALYAEVAGTRRE